jgi:hypothetical protein
MTEVAVIACGDDEHSEEIQREHQRDPAPLKMDKKQAEQRGVDHEKGHSGNPAKLLGVTNIHSVGYP